MTGNHVNGTTTASGAGVLVVACDESGSDGENLTGGNTDVFAHGSVSMSVESAAAQVREIRDRIRSPAEEYKANHLLREKHRAVLEWFLSSSGPLPDQAHVHLTEKAFLVVDRAVDLLLGEPGAAVVLYREGPAALGPEGWRAFLEAANRLLRVRHDGDPVEAFFRTVDTLPVDPATGAGAVLARIAAARARADAYRAGIPEGAAVLVPVLNPLLPAVVHTAAHWTTDGRRVELVHDRQNILTDERIEWIRRTARDRGIGLAGLRLVAAREDPRVQIADFLAGIARKVASDELGGRGDERLTALLRPYVGAGSVWGDAASWARLAPPKESSVSPESADRPAKINSSV
ncbi:DUF3800 domain-containing protein [Streptomyces sp. NPDC018693]|uniref:DUF3800 domain-containing protein n=1 Tax=unclassified Streptomyces TaxID=2593676 RepID=UPI003796EC7C